MAPIKRREQPLTPQEVIERARKQLAPCWIGIEPLISATRSPSGIKAFPLDPRINDRPWLILFIDPTSYAAQDANELCHRWLSRYEQQRMSVLLVLECPFGFLRQNPWITRWAGVRNGTFVAAVDQERLIATAFSTTELPRLLVYHRGAVPVSRSGWGWLRGVEAELQNFFRSSDPGLPLFPVIEPDHPLLQDHPGFDLSSGREKLEVSGVEFFGQWSFEKERAVTSDPAATIVVPSLGSHVGIVAEGLRSELQPQGEAKGVVEIGCEIVQKRRSLADKDLPIEPRGPGSLTVDPSELLHAEWSFLDPRLYRLLRDLPEAHRQVKFRFPEAQRIPVAVYGFRFASPLAP